MKRFLVGLFAVILSAAQSNPTGQHGATFTITPAVAAPATATSPAQLASVGFNVYRGQTSGGPYTLVGSGTFVNGATAVFVDGCPYPAPSGCSSSFADGSTWFWVVTWTTPNANVIVNTRTNNPQESKDSPELSGTFPTPQSAAAGSVKITIQ